jgi:hypothetical protein
MSQQQITTLALSVIAAGAITEHRGVGFDGAQATVQGQKVMGFSHWGAVAGDPLTIDVGGTVIAESGAVFAAGDSLIVDAQGRVIPSTGALGVAAGAVAVTSSAANGAILTGSDLPEYVVADALQAATAAGQLVEVLLRR